MNRAYATFEIKAFDDATRTFRGIATTMGTDRMEDIVEPKGARFKLPIPLLWQHGKGFMGNDPVGWVNVADIHHEHISVEATFAQVDEPASLKEDLDRAWALVKNKLVRGLSIGFKERKWEPIKGTVGVRYKEWDWLELSPVSIPANAEASILTVKSADAATLAAFGEKRGNVIRLNHKNLPGVSGQTTRVNPMKTIQEQITEFEAKRAAMESRATDLMTKAADEGRTLAADESEEYDTTKGQIKDIDSHLVRLRDHEKQIVAKAQVITPSATVNPSVNGTSARASEPITVRSNHAKGIGVARMAIALVKAQGNHYAASELAARHWPDMPEVAMSIKATVEAGDTTTSGWASQLIPAAQSMQNEFLDLLRPATILGRIPGLRRVPFNVSVPVQTAGGTYRWVGEGVAKPVTSLTLDSVTLRWAKAAGIVVITQELAKFSSPSAEMIVRDEMIAGIARFLDQQFISTNAEVSNVSPAGILNGISATSVTATTSAAFRIDMNTLLNKMAVNNVDPTDVVLLMSATQALALSLMVTDLGVRFFPDINVQGGTILGLPAIISQNVGTKIIALNAKDILLAEEGGVQIDVSTEASVEMSDTPIQGDTSPTTNAVLKSLWQNNLVGLRVEKFITWKRGRTSAVEYLNANAYAPS